MPNAFYPNQPDYLEKLNAMWNAAFVDFSVPLSAKGDLLTYDGSVAAVLPVGANGYVLTADSTEPSGLKWVAGGGGGGGVSSVAMSVPSFLSVAGSPITSSGTFAITLSGTALPVANGGTGGTSASTARSALGLVIGTNVQAQDSELQAIANLNSEADTLPYFTGSGTAALADFTTLARTIAACATAAEVRTAIGAASTTGGTETTASLGELIASAFPKATPADTDQFGYADSETSDILVSFTWLDVKTALQAYFDTLYGASGDVVGPASSVNNKVVFFDGTTGKLIKDSGLSLAGTNTGDETTTTAGALINGATAKTTPVDADYVGLMDSAASNVLKKLSWANIKATLKTYFDTLYATTAASVTPVTYSATTTIDLSTIPNGGIARITLTGNLTLQLSNGTDGKKFVLELIQDSIGSRTVSLSGTYFRFGTDIASFTATTTALKMDRVGCVYNSAATKADVVAVVKGF
jgi:hypothetical protein